MTYIVSSGALTLLTHSPTKTKQQTLIIVLSKVLQRRLIGVKDVEEGDRISPLKGY